MQKGLMSEFFESTLHEHTRWPRRNEWEEIRTDFFM